jgi:glycine hydroxymethyltransferase
VKTPGKREAFDPPFAWARWQSHSSNAEDAMFHRQVTVEQTDPAVWSAITAENRRQEDHIELIASENYASPAVMAAQGCSMTNKYAEGYPGKRYYGGCEHVDVVESLAIERLKRLFGYPTIEIAANVQPHSGAQANEAVFLALLNPGDTIMGMSLAEGGHLTHGMPLNISGKWFKVVSYGLNAQEAIDYDAMEALAHRHHPKLIIAGASAYSLHIDFKRCAQIARDINAHLMVDMAHYAGLIAAGVYPSPIPHADVVTSTTHKTLRGPRSGMILAKADLGPAIDKTVFPGMQGGPLVHIIAGKAVCFQEAMQPEFKAYARQVVANAKVLAETLAAEGYRVISGGTDTHVMLIDVFAKGMLGSEAEKALGEAGITVNKNAIPFDTNPPLKPSGVRIGSPAVTTRGMKEPEMRQIGHWIAEGLQHRSEPEVLGKIRRQVLELAEAFPLYAERRARAQAEVRA